MKAKIREFLYSQLEHERGLTATLIIHTCNKPRERVDTCVETLCKYLDNIIQNPAEQKYRKIRMSNKVNFHIIIMKLISIIILSYKPYLIKLEI
jgi:UBX domain-containing protein 6